MDRRHLSEMALNPAAVFQIVVENAADLFLRGLLAGGDGYVDGSARYVGIAALGRDLVGITASGQ